MERGRAHHNQFSANDQKQFVLNGLTRNAYFCQVTVVKLTSWPDSSSRDTELVLEFQRLAAEMVFHSEGDGGLSKLNIGKPTSKLAEGPQGDGVPTNWDPNGFLVSSTRRPTKYRTGACAYPPRFSQLQATAAIAETVVTLPTCRSGKTKAVRMSERLIL